jgi:carbon starvation protein
VFALVTLIPLVWLLAVTLTAGVQKIFHPKPAIGFLAKAEVLNRALPGLEGALAAAERVGGASLEAARKAVNQNRREHLNQLLDAGVAGTFLVLVALIVFLSVREWGLLMLRKRAVTLRESAPVWLPDYALAEGASGRLFSFLALALGLAKELSGEAQVERLAQAQGACSYAHPEESACLTQAGEAEDSVARQRSAYLHMTERRFNGVNRCC